MRNLSSTHLVSVRHGQAGHGQARHGCERHKRKQPGGDLLGCASLLTREHRTPSRLAVLPPRLVDFGEDVPHGRESRATSLGVAPRQRIDRHCDIWRGHLDGNASTELEIPLHFAEHRDIHRAVSSCSLPLQAILDQLSSTFCGSGRGGSRSVRHKYSVWSDPRFLDRLDCALGHAFPSSRKINAMLRQYRKLNTESSFSQIFRRREQHA